MTDPQPPTVRMHALPDGDSWADAAADALAAILAEAIRTRGHARILLSGGTTPAPVYRELASRPLDWNKVDLGLVDERWLQPNDPDSNAWLVRNTLLDAGARDARFRPLTQTGVGIDEAVHSANMHAHHHADAAVLGMGPDGHTASLFPNMLGLDDALHSQRDYVAVDASGCPVAAPWSRRISLTPTGLARSGKRLLLIRGDAKRALFERAIDGNDTRELPIRVAFTTPGAPLDVYWAP